MKDDKKDFFEKWHDRANRSAAICAYLEGLTIQEAIDTMDAAKRKILLSSKVDPLNE